MRQIEKEELDHIFKSNEMNFDISVNDTDYEMM